MAKIATTTATKRREALAMLYFCLSLLLLGLEPTREASLFQILFIQGLVILNLLNAMRVIRKHVKLNDRWK